MAHDNYGVKIWRGGIKCDCCQKVIARRLFDAATRMGPWATMCSACYGEWGVGLGTGRGQEYKQRGDGLFVKVDG